MKKLGNIIIRLLFTKHLFISGFVHVEGKKRFWRCVIDVNIFASPSLKEIEERVNESINGSGALVINIRALKWWMYLGFINDESKLIIANGMDSKV